MDTKQQVQIKTKTSFNDINVRMIRQNNPIKRQEIIYELIDTGEISMWDKDYDPNERLR
jgi:hypothetical protein